MIYGLNFNLTPIPESLKRRFAARLPVYQCSCGHETIAPTRHTATHTSAVTLTRIKREYAYLQGVATSIEDKRHMLIQADNGSRKLHTVERKTAGAPFYGIYTR